MRRAAAVLSLWLSWPAYAAAQFPAELAGRVVEESTAQPITGAMIEAGAARTVTDASGAFVLRVPEAGQADVTISHPAYAELRVSRRLESGRTSVEVFVLQPAPVSIDGIDVIAEAAAGFVIERDAIERSGAQTLAELLRGVPGVVVRDVSGGGARISIRGGAADQVLVLVDGVPVNDALTGEADADAVSLQGVRSVRVVVGAQSARHGGRAATGVVLLQTDDTHDPFASLTLEAGSLGAVALDAQAGARAGAIATAAGVRYRGVDGELEYERPDALGGGSTTRGNADEREIGGFAGIAAAPFGRMRLRVDVARIERGLPGPMHAPTPEARQGVVRGDARASWVVPTEWATVSMATSGGWHLLRYDDPAPAFGPAYHDTTHVREATLRLEAERTSGSRFVRTLAAGGDTRRVELESTSLDPSSVTRTEGGLFARGALELAAHRFSPRIGLAARADRWDDDWVVSHDASLGLTGHGVTASIAHRSAFSPPAASDQFFAAGFAIAPNPALRPERVRSEVELTLTAALDVLHVPLEAGFSAFRGDIDGMIVWAPDFRFVWSPRNRDVKRSGGEAWLRASPIPGLALGAWGALARVTYDWAGDADTVQVVYRPRYSGGATAEWTPGPWTFAAAGVYTGLRYATPGHANPLPAYWDVRVALGRSFRRGPFDIDASLRVDRLLDNTDAFVHGYAEPGRRISLELRARASERANDITNDITLNPNER